LDGPRAWAAEPEAPSEGDAAPPAVGIALAWRFGLRRAAGSESGTQRIFSFRNCPPKLFTGLIRLPAPVCPGKNEDAGPRDVAWPGRTLPTESRHVAHQRPHAAGRRRRAATRPPLPLLSAESVSLLVRWRRAAVEHRKTAAVLWATIGDSRHARRLLLRTREEWCADALELAGLFPRPRPSAADEGASITARQV